MAQWVKNTTAVVQVKVEVRTGSSDQSSGLRICHCYSCIDCSYGSDSIPGPGASIGCRAAIK